ncbi:MAG: antibiotic biosynthesis monooxygenase [Dehalococcoidia bacterium]|nr:antibiotic biosynthesis monooxygenase [Dehalococcoidia bacterium]
MFVAMNRFKVTEGQGDAFEQMWRERKSYLDQVPGFLHFLLLRGDEPGDYISHSTWESRDAFVAWTQSESFASGHRQGSVQNVLQGPPVVSLYDAVITEGGGIPASK